MEFEEGDSTTLPPFLGRLIRKMAGRLDFLVFSVISHRSEMFKMREEVGICGALGDEFINGVAAVEIVVDAGEIKC